MLRLEIRSFSREELRRFLTDALSSLTEDEALAVLENPYVTPAMLQQMAQSPRLTGFYSVRLRLVAHRQTPQQHATKLVHYLYWTDLVRLSTDVKISAQVRRAMENLLLNRVEELTLGEKVESARRCSHALIKVLLFDPDPKVFAALLINPRLREDDLVHLASSPRATAEKLALLASDGKWSFRYAIRKALVMNPVTPRSAAVAQLRHLTPKDLRMIRSHPATSLYLRRCIERLAEEGPVRVGRS
ncbi:MAG TPA: hypothetical protein VNL91_05650, partial [Thermoanaerobaculia bacterium]|nr:hypothetical protein [Thermoanaerobaculia bacterium]